jgi:hypothetical protein
LLFSFPNNGLNQATVSKVVEDTIFLASVILFTLELEPFKSEPLTSCSSKSNYLVGNLINEPIPPSSPSILQLRRIDPSLVQQLSLSISLGPMLALTDSGQS